MATIYVCVYRRHVASPADWRRTVGRSRSDPVLAQFLREYWRADRSYDCGLQLPAVDVDALEEVLTSRSRSLSGRASSVLALVLDGVKTDPRSWPA